MMWLFAILIVLAMGGVALVAAGHGTPLQPSGSDRPPLLLPREGRIGSDDLRRVRFSLAFRGYRMSEVDALLDRLAVELEQDDEDADVPGAPDGGAHGGDPAP